MRTTAAGAGATELALDFDQNDCLEFIEFLGGHYGKLKPYIYDISVFDAKDTDVVRILSEHNNGEIDETGYQDIVF